MKIKTHNEKTKPGKIHVPQEGKSKRKRCCADTVFVQFCTVLRHLDPNGAFNSLVARVEIESPQREKQETQSVCDSGHHDSQHSKTPPSCLLSSTPHRSTPSLCSTQLPLPGTLPKQTEPPQPSEAPGSLASLFDSCQTLGH